jgi:hypothetical protein
MNVAADSDQIAVTDGLGKQCESHDTPGQQILLVPIRA